MHARTHTHAHVYSRVHLGNSSARGRSASAISGGVPTLQLHTHHKQRRHIHTTRVGQRRLKKQYTVQELLDAAASKVNFILPEDAVKVFHRERAVFVDVREPPEWVETGKCCVNPILIFSKHIHI